MIENRVPKAKGTSNKVRIRFDWVPRKIDNMINSCGNQGFSFKLKHSFDPFWPFILANFGPITIFEFNFEDGDLFLIGKMLFPKSRLVNMNSKVSVAK